MAQRSASETTTSEKLLEPYKGKRYFPLLAHANDCKSVGGAEAIGIIKGEIFEKIVDGLTLEDLREADEVLVETGLSEYVRLSAVISARS